MISTDKYKELSAIKLLFTSGVLLIIGHLLLQQYMPNIAAGGIGFLLLILILGYILFYRHDLFGFIMVVYICSHFSYGDNHGGLWNIIAAVMLMLYFLSGRHQSELKQTNTIINILLILFVFSNIVGWVIKNPMPIAPLLEGVSAFTGYMLMYLLASKIEITANKIRILLSIVFFLLMYQGAIALIQYYALFDVGTPLVGGNTLGLGKVTEFNRPVGTIGHFELFSEYALLMVCLLMPLLSSTTTRTEIKFNYTIISIMLFACISIIIITSMRGAFILAVLVAVFYYIIFPFRIFSAVDKITQQIKIIVLVILLLPAVSIYIGVNEFVKDFSRLDTKKMNVESVITGKSINRGGLSDIALRRMDSESWLIGYGSGTIDSNRWAWFGLDVSKSKLYPSDFHNLYLSLPMIYGWIGSLAFLSIIILTLIRLFSVTLQYRKEKSFLLVVSFGLTVMWAVFIVHEYKISILRNANYQMLFWIWLGLSSSVIKTIKKKWQVINKLDSDFNISLNKVNPRI